MNRLASLLLTLIAAQVGASVPAAAQQTVLGFDEAVSRASPPLPVRYGNQGVLLPRTAELIALPSATSGSVRARSKPNVLASRPGPGPRDDEPLDIEFTDAVDWVAVWTGVPWKTHGGAVTLTLDAFGSDGSRVATESRSVTGPSDIDVQLRARPATRGEIRRVRLRAVDASGEGLPEVVDDLTIGSLAPLPVLAKMPPEVHLGAPAAGATISPEFAITGEISGEGLLPGWAPPRLFITTQSPLFGEASQGRDLAETTEWTWAPDAKGSIVLRFSTAGRLPYPGDSTVTIEAYNPAGVGSASSTLTYAEPGNRRVVTTTNEGRALESPVRQRSTTRSAGGSGVDQEEWIDAYSVVLSTDLDVPAGDGVALGFQVGEPTLLFIKVTSHGTGAGKLVAKLISPGGASAWTATAGEVRDRMAVAGGRVIVSTAMVSAGTGWSLQLSNTAADTLIAEVLVLAAVTKKPN